MCILEMLCTKRAKLQRHFSNWVIRFESLGLTFTHRNASHQSDQINTPFKTSYCGRREWMATEERVASGTKSPASKLPHQDSKCGKTEGSWKPRAALDGDDLGSTFKPGHRPECEVFVIATLLNAPHGHGFARPLMCTSETF